MALSNEVRPAKRLANGRRADGRGAPVVTAVVRTADVLSFLAEAQARTVGVTEVANGLGLSKAVVFRILVSLRDRGYVEFDAPSRRYRLGPRSLSLGMAYLERTDVRKLAHDALVDLCDRTSQTATLSVRSGWERIYVDQVIPSDDIKMVVPIGRPFPLHAGSSSKAFLAFLPPEQQERFFAERSPLARLTDQTVIDESRLRDELKEIRGRGFATSQGERQVGAGSVAAPVLGRDGVPVAVISICGPVERFRPHAARSADLLLEETTRLSGQLGLLDGSQGV